MGHFHLRGDVTSKTSMMENLNCKGNYVAIDIALHCFISCCFVPQAGGLRWVDIQTWYTCNIQAFTDGLYQCQAYTDGIKAVCSVLEKKGTCCVANN